MKNKLSDLNNHLFAELECLSDEDLKEEKLLDEIERAKAITSVASQIINNANLALKSEQFKDQRNNINKQLPVMLED